MAGMREGMKLPDINVLVGISNRLICWTKQVLFSILKYVYDVVVKSSLSLS